MSSAAFKLQKNIGREFETAMIPVLQEMGMRVIDVDHWKYSQKRGRDVMVEVKGERCSIDFKYDKKSAKTNRVCIDLDSLSHTDSGIWIFGLPNAPGSSEIDVYAVKTQDLAPWVYQAIKDHPEWMWESGEFEQRNPMIPKAVFTSLPFISKFKTIEIH